jgi:hypothetical protein
MSTNLKTYPPREDARPSDEEDTDVLSILMDEAEQAERAARPRPAPEPPPRRLYNLD